MGGRLRPESPAGINRNGWPASSGIAGRNRPEYAWIDDATLFAKIDYDLGLSYNWKSIAEIDGGRLYFQNEEAKLDRSPSTAVSPATWEMKIEKEE